MRILPSGFSKFASSEYWLNPPEDDIPHCNICDLEMDIEKDGSAICRKCGYKIPPGDREEIPVELEGIDFQKPPAPEKCPHGKEWSECNACMIESDRAYDANRERRAMKIENAKLSQSEWLHIGKQAGWITESMAMNVNENSLNDFRMKQDPLEVYQKIQMALTDGLEFIKKLKKNAEQLVRFSKDLEMLKVNSRGLPAICDQMMGIRDEVGMARTIGDRDLAAVLQNALGRIENLKRVFTEGVVESKPGQTEFDFGGIIIPLIVQIEQEIHNAATVCISNYAELKGQKNRETSGKPDAPFMPSNQQPASSPTEPASTPAVASSNSGTVKTAEAEGEFPFTDDELMALKSLGKYNVSWSDQISIEPCVNVQKNGDNDFSIYNRTTQEYETSRDFQSVLALVKKWNSKPSPI